MYDDPAMLKVTLERVQFSMVQMLEKHLCKSAIEKAIKQAVTPEAIQALLVPAIEDELRRSIGNIARSVVSGNAKAIKYIEDSARWELERQIKEAEHWREVERKRQAEWDAEQEKKRK